MAFDSIDQALARLKDQPPKHWAGYAGFYSSWLGGYFKEPWAMLVPMDDHGFHRGDGVFEAVRLHQRGYFDLQAHLRRLLNSAEKIGIKPYASLEEIEKIVVELARRCGLENGILRLYMTRGPGGFSPNPEESIATQLYAALTQIKPPDAERYKKGVRCLVSKVIAKDPWFSQIKSLNYLQNVLMRRECAEHGADFGVCVGPTGVICEGATENLLVVTKDGEVLVPRFDYTLRGTTVSLVMKIAEAQAARLAIKSVRFADLTVKDLKGAKEAAFVGTTLGVLPIATVDGQAIGEGKGGPIALALNAALMEKMATDPQVRTVI